jgi:hypothetical protein
VNVRIEPKKTLAKLAIGSTIDDHSCPVDPKVFVSSLSSIISANPVRHWFNE